MTDLKIESSETSGLSFNPLVPFSGKSEQTNWENLIADFLSFCLREKTFWVVTEKAKAAEWLYLKNLLFECEIHVNNETYLCAFGEKLTSKDFLQIIQTGDFYWDGILFIPTESSDNSNLIETLKKLQSFEFIGSYGDGCGITWNLPHLPNQTIITEVKKIAQSNNFLPFTA
jgi:hypothetical protein